MRPSTHRQKSYKPISSHYEDFVKLAVTGGCDFIGSNLVEELVKRGHDVVVVDDLSLGTREDIRGLDVELYTSISGFLASDEAKKLDVLFHLGMPSSPMYRENPYLVGKTINEAIEVFESARRFSDSRLRYRWKRE